MIFLKALIAFAMGMHVGRLLQWLSGALVAAIKAQSVLDESGEGLLQREPSIVGLIWRQRKPLATWFQFLPGSAGAWALGMSCGALLSVAAVLQADPVQSLLILLGLLLLLMLRIDAEHFLLPDVLVYTVLWGGLLWSAFFEPSPERAVIAASCAYIGLYAVGEGYSALRGIQMMGHGDYKLFGALAAWLDYEMAPVLLLGASLTMILLWLVFYRRSTQAEMPFGPALIIVGAVLIILRSQPWLTA